MIRTIFTAIAAAALVVLGAGVATADVISESTSSESHQKTTYEGGSYDAGTSNTSGRIVLMDGVKHVYAVVGQTPTGENIWKWVPIGTGLAPATIVHN